MAFKDKYRKAFTNEPDSGFLKIKSVYAYGKGMAKKGYPFAAFENGVTGISKYFGNLTEARVYAYRRSYYCKGIIEICRFYVDKNVRTEYGYVVRDNQDNCFWVVNEKRKPVYYHLYVDGSIKKVIKGEYDWVDLLM